MVVAALPIPDAPPYVSIDVTASTTGPFTIPFPLPPDWAGSLQCRVGGVDGAMVTAFEFTPDMTLPAGSPGGHVTLAVAVENTTVEFWRAIPITRGADYGQGPLDFNAFNTELARLTMQVQDQRLRSDLVGPNAVAAALEAAGIMQAIRPSYINVRKYGAKGNIVRCLGSITDGSNVLTITYGSIPASHANKPLWVQYMADGVAPKVTQIALRTSGTMMTLVDPNNAGRDLVNIEISCGDDDTALINNARDAMPSTGAVLLFPRDATDPECTGLYGWTDGAGLIIGDGSAAAASTKQNQFLQGDVGGTGDVFTYDVQGTGLVWMGTGVGDYMVRFKGPIRGGISNLAFEGLYRVKTGWDLKHVFNSDFIHCPINHMRLKGVDLGAHPVPAGVFIGAGGNYMRKVRASSPGASATVFGGPFIGFDIGDEAFVGADPATCVFDQCGASVPDDPAATVVNGVLVGTANTPIAFALRFCDNITFRDCFPVIGGQRRSYGVRAIVPSGASPAGAYPTEIAFIGVTPLIGGFSVDQTANTWLPHTATGHGRGVRFHYMHTGDMTDPSFLGARAIPSPEALGIQEGIGGETSDGLGLAEFQKQMTRAGILTDTTVIIEPRNNAAQVIASSAAETDIYVLDLPINIMRMFDRLAATYRVNRIIEYEACGAYLNNSGGNDNFTMRGYIGNVTDGWTQIFTSTALVVPTGASFRRWRMRGEVAARNSLSQQFFDGVCTLNAIGSAGANAGDVSFDKGNSNQFTIDMTKAQQLRLTSQMGTSSALISCNVSFRKATLH